MIGFERELVAVQPILKRQAEFDFLRGFGSEMQQLVGTASGSHVVVQAAILNGLQKSERGQEIGFAGAVRADD